MIVVKSNRLDILKNPPTNKSWCQSLNNNEHVLEEVIICENLRTKKGQRINVACGFSIMQ